MRKLLLIGVVFITGCLIFYKYSKKININLNYEVGQVIDSLNGVAVYYNGGVRHVDGRHVVDGYNVGLKYQCVEFVKRYYLEYFQHKMPDSYGHAISFYDVGLKDGALNKRRNLLQFSNPSSSKPKVGDLIVMDATRSNQFGHVAIVSEVSESEIELIQQNGGAFASTRIRIGLRKKNNKWEVKNSRVLGWLRK